MLPSIVLLYSQNELEIRCSLANGRTQGVTIKASGHKVSSMQTIELMADESLYARRRWGILEILIVFFMVIVLPTLSLAPEAQDLGPLEVFRRMNKTCFPFPYSATIVCVGAWAIHIVEGYSASVFAKSLGLKEKQCSSWFWWTCMLGFPCLRWLVCLR